jgi:hypothetical protein
MRLVERAQNILLRPGQTWPAISKEYSSVGAIYRSYVLPLAAIPALCSWIGHSLWGVSYPGIGSMHVSWGSAAMGGAATYVGQLIAVFALGLVIDVLAPTFGAKRNQVQAVKLSAYGATAAWLGGVFQLVPGGQWLTLLAALYTLYLLWSGLPTLMKPEPDQEVGYRVVTIVAAIVVYLVAAAIASAFLQRPGA